MELQVIIKYIYIIKLTVPYHSMLYTIAYLLDRINQTESILV
jgi:hypothetical protein